MGVGRRGGESPAAKPSTNPFLMEAPFYSWADVRDNRQLPPPAPGVYGWFFRKAPSGVPISGCLERNGALLLYVGIAPRRADGIETLRSRIRYHFDGNAEGSTLRLTLGCLLADELGIELRRVGSGNRMTFCAGEAKLSAWMATNARVTWLQITQPWLLETELLGSLSLPLNLDQNAAHSFCQFLKGIRADARRRARAMPVMPR
jgi:hypothetical protein